MTQQADILNIAPRELMDNEPITASNAQHFEVVSEAPTDPSAEQCMRIVEVSGSLDFWLESAEDIYGPEDGTPV